MPDARAGVALPKARAPFARRRSPFPPAPVCQGSSCGVLCARTAGPAHLRPGRRSQARAPWRGSAIRSPVGVAARSLRGSICQSARGSRQRGERFPLRAQSRPRRDARWSTCRRRCLPLLSRSRPGQLSGRCHGAPPRDHRRSVRLSTQLGLRLPLANLVPRPSRQRLPHRRKVLAHHREVVLAGCKLLV